MAHTTGRGNYRSTRAHPKPVPKSKSGAVSAKIRHLAKEGVPPKQRVAMALNMARAGRLGPRGGYKRKKKGK